MADGDHYASYDDVRNKLSNAGLGTAGNSMYDDDSLEIALDLTQVWINTYVHGDADHADLTGGNAIIAKWVQIDLVFMMILQARHMQENNLADAASIQGYWQTSPQMTFAHKQMLDIVSMNEDGPAYSGNTRSGVVY